MKILIAVPLFENIYPDTFKAIYDLDKGEHDVSFEFFRGYDVAAARNNIATYTLENDYDYVLMIDNDQVLPKDALLNLLETEASYPLGHCVVTGYAASRPKSKSNDTGRTTAFRFAKYTYDSAYNESEFAELRDKGVTKLQIRGGGLGCVLIHRSIFEKLDFPWFKWIQRKTGQLSEDLFFCELLPTIQTPMYLDLRVSCGHMMRYVKFL